MLFSPLEQFSIDTLLPLYWSQYDVSFTNTSLFMVIASVCIVSLNVLYTPKLVCTRYQSIVEQVYVFVCDICIEQLGTRKAHLYFPFVFTLFVFLVFTNLIGLIPYAFTPTTHLVLTFTLSFTIFIGVTLIGFNIHGIRFFEFFLPPGVPYAISPLLVLIELISYIFRGISLGVRLFANMMAGHTLLTIFSGFVVSLCALGIMGTIVSVVPLTIVFALTFLEVGVALLQAYVFTILTVVYIRDSVELH
jgi:ATP synthase subunit 6